MFLEKSQRDFGGLILQIKSCYTESNLVRGFERMPELVSVYQCLFVFLF
jgi:hypothetical protein